MEKGPIYKLVVDENSEREGLRHTLGHGLAQEGAARKWLPGQMDLMERTLTVGPSTKAYFSMEIAVALKFPLTRRFGDIKLATFAFRADHGVPMVGITLLHRKGYFHQH